METLKERRGDVNKIVENKRDKLWIFKIAPHFGTYVLEIESKVIILDIYVSILWTTYIQRYSA